MDEQIGDGPGLVRRESVWAFRQHHVSTVADPSRDRLMAQGVVSEEASEDSGEQVMDLVLSGVAACPDAITELLVNGFNQSMGEELSDEGVECVTEYVEANPEDAAQVFSEGGSETETFSQQLGLACGGFLFGG